MTLARRARPIRIGLGAANRRKVSPEILAEMIGTTRSRVSHFMNKLRKWVYIKYNGKLEIHGS
jgi:biotin operon repressor